MAPDVARVPGVLECVRPASGGVRIKAAATAARISCGLGRMALFPPLCSCLARWQHRPAVAGRYAIRDHWCGAGVCREVAVRVLVIGAGIGGLGAARVLSRCGQEGAVFERAGHRRTAGGALTLWSNGTGILSELGVSLDGVGAPIEMLQVQRWDGRFLMSIDVARAASRFGHPHVLLPRRRLLERLADGLPPSMVTFGRACTGLAQDADRVRAEFDDGTTASGDLLIGADGHRSVVRDHLWGGDPSVPSGWATWQGLSAVPIDVTSSRRGLMVAGGAGLCGLVPGREGLLQWWVDLRWPAGGRPSGSPLARLPRSLRHLGGPGREVLATAHEADVEFFAHYRHHVP